MKVGLAGQDAPASIMPTFVSSGGSRKYVGDAVEQCNDPSQLHFRRAFDKGYLMNWDVIEELWTRAFGKEVLGITPAEHSLLVTEPLFNHEPLQVSPCD